MEIIEEQLVVRPEFTTDTQNQDAIIAEQSSNTRTQIVVINTNPSNSAATVKFGSNSQHFWQIGNDVSINNSNTFFIYNDTNGI